MCKYGLGEKVKINMPNTLFHGHIATIAQAVGDFGFYQVESLIPIQQSDGISITRFYVEEHQIVPYHSRIVLK